MSIELITYHDIAGPFLIHHSSIRGRVVRLQDVTNTILGRHAYPPVVSYMLAELLLVATMLSANLKGKGILTLQIRGDGPVSLMVVDITAEHALRGYADVSEEDIEMLKQMPPEHAALKSLFGKGYLAITLDIGTEPYQGIVELTGDTLTEAMQTYFTHSEQSEVFIKTAVTREENTQGESNWVAGGIMLQHVPGEGGVGLAEGSIYDEDPQEQWCRACALTTTLKEEEVTDIHLSPSQLLYRLFNEDGVWVYDAHNVIVGCRCSREKIQRTLKSFSAEDIEAMQVDGIITVICQFCNQAEIFKPEDL